MLDLFLDTKCISRQTDLLIYPAGWSAFCFAPVPTVPHPAFASYLNFRYRSRRSLLLLKDCRSCCEINFRIVEFALYLGSAAFGHVDFEGFAFHDFSLIGGRRYGKTRY